ncbi:MAG: hypothetical protein OEU36_23190 [Gammaproteobacteria bacterium]|nr:hypothetical protein [Gammaproteobacteria bacterium]
MGRSFAGWFSSLDIVHWNGDDPGGLFNLDGSQRRRTVRSSDVEKLGDIAESGLVRLDVLLFCGG